ACFPATGVLVGSRYIADYGAWFDDRSVPQKIPRTPGRIAAGPRYERSRQPFVRDGSREVELAVRVGRQDHRDDLVLDRALSLAVRRVGVIDIVRPEERRAVGRVDQLDCVG